MTEFCVTGALPPPGMEWQVGKTAASIRFVKEGERYLETLPMAKFSFNIQARLELLRERIAKVKSGEEQLWKFEDVEAWLNLPEA